VFPALTCTPWPCGVLQIGAKHEALLLIHI
jgi:hypothetical protein